MQSRRSRQRGYRQRTIAAAVMPQDSDHLASYLLVWVAGMVRDDGEYSRVLRCDLLQSVKNPETSVACLIPEIAQ
jgi:hypothetical protein